MIGQGSAVVDLPDLGVQLVLFEVCFHCMGLSALEDLPQQREPYMLTPSYNPISGEADGGSFKACWQTA